MKLRRRLVPYGLLAPGRDLARPLLRRAHVLHGRAGAPLGHPSTEGFAFTWEWSNFPDALDGRGEQIVRTFFYSGAATILALLIAYPLAYAIAVKASPRWRLLLLFAVIAPFFTTYLIRTIAWKTILADSSPIVDVLQFLAIVPDDGRVLATSGAVIAGLTYNFLPFMILPIYASLERIDLSLIEAAKDLYASARQAFLQVTLPLTAPGIVAGVPAHLHPGVRRLRQRAAPRQPEPVHDRQQDPVALPERAQLPGGGGALVPDDGRDPDRGPHLHPRRRHRGVHGRTRRRTR